MRRRIRLATLIALLGASVAMDAGAQPRPAPGKPGTPPPPPPAAAPATLSDMKGIWKGTLEAVVSGMAIHHPPGAPSKVGGNNRLRSQAYTYKIEGQDGKRFWGTIASDYAVTNIVGTISLDGRMVYMTDRDGFYDGTVIDPDTIQLCYRQVSPPTMVVGCAELKRQK